MSVILFVVSLTEIRLTCYLQFWMRYLIIFWRHSLDFCTLGLTFSPFLTHCLLKIGFTLYSLQFLVMYLSKIFRRHCWNVWTLLPNNFRIFVCISVYLLPHFLAEIRLTLLYLNLLMRYIQEYIKWQKSNGCHGENN